MKLKKKLYHLSFMQLMNNILLDITEQRHHYDSNRVNAAAHSF